MLRYSGLTEYINLETLKNNRLKLFAIIESHYVSSILLYIFIHILTTTFLVPVTIPLTLIGGFLFGTIGATLATTIGATIGATLTFLMFRYVLGNAVQKKYHSRLAAFNKNIEHYGAHYILIANLLLVPFFIVNIGASLTKIPITTFMWTTSLGIIPGSFVYAYAGKQISTINELSDLFSLPIIMVFALLITISIISIFIKNYRVKNKKIT